MKNENIFYENDDSAMQEMRKQAEQAMHEHEVYMQKMKEQAMLKTESPEDEMKRQAMLKTESPEDEMRRQAMIKEYDDMESNLGGRHR